jgi:oligoendopeptidase F
MATATALPQRKDLAREDTWNLESIYPDDARWEADFARCEQMLPEVEALAGTLGNGPEEFLHAIQRMHETEMLLSQLMVYAFMRKDEDTTNPTYQALAERTSMLGAKFGSATAFFAPEALALPDEKLDEYLAANEDLRPYTHFLSELRRQRAHIRSAEVEAVLAEAGEVTRAPNSIFGMLNDADLKFPTIRDEEGNEIELTKGRYILLLESKDRRVRRDAFEALYGAYAKLRNTWGATLSGAVRRDRFEASVRGYDSALAAALEPDAIPLEVYHNLVDTVNKNLHHLHRYLKLRKAYLGVDELHMYDMYVPLVPGETIEIEYDEARRMVEEGLAPLGAEYIDVMHAGLYTDRWVDVYENEGKRSGAYSSGTYTTQPFILMNYQKNLNNVYTLAHELGHSMHSHFTRTSQPYVYGSYTIFVAEVASTLNEALLTDYLLKRTDDRAVRLQILNQQIDELRGTLFRQTMFAEFELEIHRRSEAGEALTADTFTAIYRDLLNRYFGPDVVIDDPVMLEWARIPHFYSGFYVYKYATGISAATALAHKILTEKQPAVERYLGFLRGGSSKTSIELLRDAGVDMTQPEPVEQAIGVFASLVDQFEAMMHEEGNGASPA